MAAPEAAPRPLAGMAALVTGGNRGIGLATVRGLAAAGARVTFTARRPEALAEASAALAGTGATGRLCEATDPAGMAEVMAGGFDILINNVGQIAPIGRIPDVDIAEWARSLEVNLLSAFIAIRLALPAMLARGGGRIVNLSSGAAHRPMEGWSAYCSAKAGLAMLTACVHEEFGAQGIRVFGFAPGVVDTGMQAEIRASGLNPVARLRREDLAPPEDAARAIAWLCTPAADRFAGREIDIRSEEVRRAAGLGARP